MEKDWIKDYEKRQKEAKKEAKKQLKEFGVLLKPLDITKVELDYDGCGDSGAFENVTLYKSHGGAYEGDLPQGKFKTLYSSEEGEDIKQAIEDFCYQFLPDGWELNEGSFGTMVIDLRKNTIKLKHNDRYESSNYSEEDIKL